MAGSRGRGRWSAVVRAAFLASLSQNGGVRGSCAAVGMTVASVYQLRNRDAEFAAAWDAALERARAVRAARQSALVPRNASLPGYRIRRDGWTEARQKTFLRALSETGCVRDACVRAVISSTSAYRLRSAQPDFARAWERALAKAAPTIEQAAFERAVHGWDEVVTRDGRELSRRRRYSDSLLRLLMERGMLADGLKRRGEPPTQKELVERAQKAAYAAGGFFATKASREAAEKSLLKKLDGLAKRMRMEEEEKAEKTRAAEPEAQLRLTGPSARGIDGASP